MGCKKQIESLVSDRPQRQVIEEIITESYQLALAYLRKKSRHGRLSVDFFGLSIEDLALDCIADLFERDEYGRFTQFITYYDSLSWQSLSDAELHMALRRLVFSQVNDGLFRRYRQADPNLSKIIRNLKIAVRANPACALVRRNGEAWLVADSEGALKSLPLAPPELLEIYFTSFIAGTIEIPTVVSAFLAFSRDERQYANGYPLVRLARAVRSSLIRLNAVDQDQETDASVFLSGEVQRSIALAVERAKAEMYSSYVEGGKLDVATFDRYFYAVEDVMESEYAGDSEGEKSYYEALRMYKPDLSKAVYRRHHRNRFEYIAKKCRSKLLQYLED